MNQERTEVLPIPETKKDLWLRELTEFVVEANLNTWAADGAEVSPERAGYKELEYVKGDWRLRDSYTGFFRAPGMTTVYYKGTPVWNMQYGGHGMTDGYENRADTTFRFLRAALSKVTQELPFRGPVEYIEGNNRYVFELIHGDVTDCLWREEITEDDILTFTQTGMAGIMIHKDSDRKPTLPWNL